MYFALPRRYFSFLLAIFIVFSSVNVFAGSSAPVDSANRKINILFIGNSLTYYNGMPQIFKRIAKSKDKNVYVEALTKSKYILPWFYTEGEYLSKFNSRKWDYIVLQDGAHRPIDSLEAFYDDIRIFDKEIKKINATTVLFIHNRVDVPNGKVDSELQKPVTDAYTTVGRELGSIVVPAGSAWVDFSEKHPDVKLYNRDNIHPTLAGSYIDACAFYSVFFNESPEGGSTEDLKGTEYEGLGGSMQMSAWKSTCKYYAANPGLPYLSSLTLLPQKKANLVSQSKSDNQIIKSKKFKINRTKATISIGKAYLPYKIFKSGIILPKGYNLIVLKADLRTPVVSGKVIPGMEAQITSNKKVCKVYSIIK